MKFVIFLLSVSVVLSSCKEEKLKDTLFRRVPSDYSNIEFANELDYTEELNTYTFRNFYNGGGVGLGDFNNDGLLDIFFAGNLVSNRLYLNQGKLIFKDITESAGLFSEGVWTTGVSVVDINGDGYLDIYICKSGPPGGEKRHNELFINNQNLTFVEKSKEYGLDFEGLSVHSVFFDFDKDGDLDCYLLNNSLKSVGNYDLRKDQRMISDPMGGNKLLENRGGRFIDITTLAGIYSSNIGFGLGVSISDINEDGWDDIYVANDFFERDYLYINNGNGTFKESLESYVNEISMGAMGVDVADLTNDAKNEIFVTEMLPETEKRLKTSAQFENWGKYLASVKAGYFHQFGRNTLQLNNGNGTFSEIGRLTGMEATDWSWGVLLFDMNNDGWKDVFISNGIYKDLLDQDYVNFVATPDIIRKMIQSEDNVLMKLVDSIPSVPLPNYAYKNEGGLSFTNKVNEWGFSELSYSNGSAYGDLDNDGDMDLVVNNVNMEAFVYENRSTTMYPDNHWIELQLRYEFQNKFAIGSKVTVFHKNTIQYQELRPVRGFMSSIDYKLHFGVNGKSAVDSIKVEWPNGMMNLYHNIPLDSVTTLTYSGNGTKLNKKVFDSTVPVFVRSDIFQSPFVHHENPYNDFDKNRLLFHMISSEGPCLCSGDVNGDHLDDFYIGGARGQAGELYVQIKNGLFAVKSDVLSADSLSEDTGCAFFDANNDGFDDLYVASGSNELSPLSSLYLDRLYLSLPGLKFKKSNQLLPTSKRFESTKSVEPADFDKDGDVDLFVGTRSNPSQFGSPVNGYLLVNDGHANLTNKTDELAPELKSMGMITDAKWVDINNDGKLDLVVVGEWMPIKVFINQEGRLIDHSNKFGLLHTNGWYNTLEVCDVNNDGLVDIIVGNHGLNSRFRASSSHPLKLYLNDFDGNGDLDPIITQYFDDQSYPMVLRNEILSQIPSLKKKFVRYKQYAGKSMNDIFYPEQLQDTVVLRADVLESFILINKGNSFDKLELPMVTQFSPTYAITTEDFNGDGNIDILMGGNLSRVKPEMGSYNAGYGTLLLGDGKGNFEVQTPAQSGISIRGDIRKFRPLKIAGQSVLIVARNNDSMEFYKYLSK